MSAQVFSQSPQSEELSLRQTLLIMLLLFIFGLNMPMLSLATMVFAFVIIAMSWKRTQITDYVVQIYWLLFFLIPFVYMSEFYDQRLVKHSLRDVAYILSAFSFGYMLSEKRIRAWPIGAVPFILAIIAGMVAYAFMGILDALMSGNILGIKNRMAMSTWQEDVNTNATLMAMYSSLGLCLLPTLIFGKPQEITRRKWCLYATVILVLAVMGLMVNIMLQNRSPLVALSMAFVLSLLVFFSRKRVSTGQKLRTMFVISIVLIVIIMMFSINQLVLKQLNIVQRVEEVGFETGRFSAWSMALEGLIQFPMGGKLSDLGHREFAHNFWLDIGRDVGVIPMIPVVIFSLMNIWKYITVVRRVESMFLSILLVCLGCSFFMGLMIEPVMSASFTYFPAVCILFGLVRRIDYDMKQKAALPQQEDLPGELAEISS